MSKRNDEKLTHKVFARVTKKKYEELRKQLERSRCKTLCELVRDILTNKEIVTVSYDATQDKLIAELSGIRSQLQAIGRNINQVTRQLHQEKLPPAQRELLLNLAGLQQQTERSVAGLFTTIAQLSEKWLPE